MSVPYFTSHRVIRPYASNTSSTSLVRVVLLKRPINKLPSLAILVSLTKLGTLDFEQALTGIA